MVELTLAAKRAQVADGDDKMSSKMKAAMRLLNDARKVDPTEKVIVFSCFTKFLDMFHDPLWKGRFKFVEYKGSISLAQRRANLEQFRHDDKTTVLLMSLKCGALGLNLTCASRIILLDLVRTACGKIATSFPRKMFIVHYCPILELALLVSCIVLCHRSETGTMKYE